METYVWTNDHELKHILPFNVVESIFLRFANPVQIPIAPETGSNLLVFESMQVLF